MRTAEYGGRAYSIGVGQASVRVAPQHQAAQVTEMLFGEAVTTGSRIDGWAYVTSIADGYSGYVPEEDLATLAWPTARVRSLMAPAFSMANLKAPVCKHLPLNARLEVEGLAGDFLRIGVGAYVHKRHVSSISEVESDFVAVAERFLGAAYVWGGKTSQGLDCSGLVQTSLQACGLACPRDSHQQEAALGSPVADAPVRRGDLVFWKGHVGIMRDADVLLHANMFHLEVASEPLAQAVARISPIAGPITAVKRLDTVSATSSVE